MSQNAGHGTVRDVVVQHPHGGEQPTAGTRSRDYVGANRAVLLLAIITVVVVAVISPLMVLATELDICMRRTPPF